MQEQQAKSQQFAKFPSETHSYALVFLIINLPVIWNGNIHLHTYVYKTLETFSEDIEVWQKVVPRPFRQGSEMPLLASWYSLPFPTDV